MCPRCAGPANAMLRAPPNLSYRSPPHLRHAPLAAPQSCDSPLVAAPCNQPLLNADAKDKVQITAKVAKGPLKAADGLTPEHIVIKLCFSKPFVVDRPWRKPNDAIDVSAAFDWCDYGRGGRARRDLERLQSKRLGSLAKTPGCNLQHAPLHPPRAARAARHAAALRSAPCSKGLACVPAPHALAHTALTSPSPPAPALLHSQRDRSCPQTVATLPVAANNTYTVTWPVPKGAPKATWYVKVFADCKNGTETVFCQYDSTADTNYVATQIIESMPTAMKAAVAVCSCIAPVFLALFFIKERMLKKTA